MKTNAERGGVNAPPAQAPELTLSCVILTMGDRPAEVSRAIDSVLAQHGPAVELVVVGNGAEVTGLPAGVRTVSLPENVGVAAGRNAGVQVCTGDVVLFLDDDGWYPDQDLAAHIAARFAADPDLAVLSMRIVDPASDVCASQTAVGGSGVRVGAGGAGEAGWAGAGAAEDAG